MNTVISVKVDKKVKAAAQEVAKSVGLNLSSLINSYLIQVVATRRIVLYAPEQMTKKMEKIITGAESDIKKGRVSRTFTNVEDFIADLNK